MKNKIIYSILASIVMLGACKKELPTQSGKSASPLPQMQKSASSSDNEFHVTLKNNFLAFQSIADYEKLITDNENVQDSHFIETISSFSGYTSYNRAHHQFLDMGKNDLIGDELMGTVLNSDNIVQIGSYIFKVDPGKEKVYMLPETHQELLSDLLAENEGNSNIKVFSTSDNILEDLKNGATPKDPHWWIFCTEGGIGPKPVIDYFSITSITVDYLKLGIYFAGRVIVPSGSTGDYLFDANPIEFKLRCGSNTGPYSTQNNAGSYNPIIHVQELVPYRGITPLSKLWIKARASLQGSSPIIYSKWIEIRSNY